MNNIVPVSQKNQAVKQVTTGKDRRVRPETEVMKRFFAELHENPVKNLANACQVLENSPHEQKLKDAVCAACFQVLNGKPSLADMQAVKRGYQSLAKVNLEESFLSILRLQIDQEQLKLDVKRTGGEVAKQMKQLRENPINHLQTACDVRVELQDSLKKAGLSPRVYGENVSHLFRLGQAIDAASSQICVFGQPSSAEVRIVASVHEKLGHYRFVDENSSKISLATDIARAAVQSLGKMSEEEDIANVKSICQDLEKSLFSGPELEKIRGWVRVKERPPEAASSAAPIPAGYAVPRPTHSKKSSADDVLASIDEF